MRNSNVYAVPGFLGSIHDWDPFNFDLTPVKTDQFSSNNFNEWAAGFNAFVESKKQANPILMGYSLGGRLGLHALIQKPFLWKGGIIISAHPGLISSEIRNERLMKDLYWAKRFKEERWDGLMQAWEAQEVFKHDSFSFIRPEGDCCRRYLSDCLDSFSLGRQEDLRHKIEELPMPILWVIGEKDRKLIEAGGIMNFKHPFSCTVVLKEAGHRAPWAQPELFRKAIESFLQKIL
ncbi:MAG: alpha/beta fold hydrolase [Candidatus Protochlamydia sp.]|nr:alpha/beta fold hydrolase [Candidatus Protochlamydia sp.]